MKPLLHSSTSDTVASAVRHMIVDGELTPGERINEVHLSQQLGVSRTPLREALARLAHEGTLDTIPRIGHFVRALTVEELEQLYQIRPLLDPEALRLAGIPSKQKIVRLRELNESIAAADDPDEVINADDEWHIELVADCPNKILVDLIKQFMRRTHRYEVALMRERGNILAAARNHRSVINALKRGELDDACEALRTNLESGRAPIIAWLKSRSAAGKKS
ncbi:MAG TPA: GntR family transcriptional regulator [Gemmatimonadaceae bacterium]|nr:GntR family transcriptional regulator [Gemmatimonadaceae bacterium]